MVFFLEKKQRYIFEFLSFSSHTDLHRSKRRKSGFSSIAITRKHAVSINPSIQNPLNKNVELLQQPLAEVRPLHLDVVARGDRRTRGATVRKLQGVGNSTFVLSVQNDNDFRSRCE